MSWFRQRCREGRLSVTLWALLRNFHQSLPSGYDLDHNRQHVPSPCLRWNKEVCARSARLRFRALRKKPEALSLGLLN